MNVYRLTLTAPFQGGPVAVGSILELTGETKCVLCAVSADRRTIWIWTREPWPWAKRTTVREAA